MTVAKVFVQLVAKDLRLEWRSRRLVVSTTAFGVLLVLIVGMALDTPARLDPEWASGLLWMAVFFTDSVAALRHDGKELELGAWQALLLLPVDRSVLYYAKWASHTVFLWMAEAALTLAFFIILNQPPPAKPAPFVLLLAGGGLCLCGVSSFLMSVLTTSSLREVLLPLSLFPLTVPLFLALTRLTAATLAGTSLPLVWAEVWVGYLVVFGVLPWLVYETLLEV
jgi:heme exporter protein B